MIKLLKGFFSKFKVDYSEFIPKSYLCFKEGYSFKTFYNDLFAGIGVGIITLPLAIGFAIASGALPERGLYTAIIAGFLISLLGGSRVQIGGPTGAFVVVIYSTIQKHGYEGLALATFIAGVLILLMGLFRFGSFLKFIPYPVVTGFTAGIGLTIFSSQIRDFLGLETGPLPVEFIDKWKVYFHHCLTCNPWAIVVGSFSLIAIFLGRSFFPRLPGILIVLAVTTLFVQLFSIPIETIGTKFGNIPNTLPSPQFPEFNMSKLMKVFPDGVTIALLGAIESLLSASIADGMMGSRHRSNSELLAQGIANIGSMLFGGLPATGAIARTATNVRMGGKTPLAGMIHALTIFFLMVLFSDAVLWIPLSSLAAILIYIAWTMSEVKNCIAIFQGHFSEALVMIITFLLTILIDITVAVQVGVVLAAILFMKRMSDATRGVLIEKERDESETLLYKDVPNDVTIFEIDGPLFFAAVDILNEAYQEIYSDTKVFILNLHRTPLIDLTGMQALKKFQARCQSDGVLFLLTGVNEKNRKLLEKTQLQHGIHPSQLFSTLTEALDRFKKEMTSNNQLSSLSES